MGKFLIVALGTILTVTVLPASAQTPANGQPAAPPINAVSRVVWRMTESQSVLHLGSSVECPLAAGNFSRSEVSSSDVSATNGFCRYADRQGQEIAIAIQRAGLDFAKTVEILQSVIGRSAGTPLEGGDQPTFESTRNWEHRLYATDAEHRSGYWISRFHDWDITLRAKFAPENTDAVLAALAALTEPMEKAEEAHFTACSKMTPVRDGGRRLTRESEITSAFASAALVANGVAKTAGERSPVWCAFGMAISTSVHIATYRNALDPVGGASRLAATTGFSTSIVLSIHDPFLALTNRSLADVFDVMVETPDALLVVGFYNGRPSFEDLARVFSGSDIPVYVRAEKFENRVTAYGSLCARPVIHNGVVPPREPPSCAKQ